VQLQLAAFGVIYRTLLDWCTRAAGEPIFEGAKQDLVRVNLVRVKRLVSWVEIEFSLGGNSDFPFVSIVLGERKCRCWAVCSVAVCTVANGPDLVHLSTRTPQ
jgi:hypothetical protein